MIVRGDNAGLTPGHPSETNNYLAHRAPDLSPPDSTAVAGSAHHLRTSITRLDPKRYVFEP